jgi:hypothetical protein
MSFKKLMFLLIFWNDVDLKLIKGKESMCLMVPLLLTSNWNSTEASSISSSWISKWPLNLLREPAIYAIMECLALISTSDWLSQ